MKRSDLKPGQTRRRFLRNTGLLVVAGSLGSKLAACDSGVVDAGETEGATSTVGIAFDGSTLTIDLAQQTILAMAGGFLLIRSVNGQSVRMVVVNMDGTEIKALTSLCTHQSCEITRYNPNTQQLRCPCHDSRFGLDGNVVQGPAVRPLNPFEVVRTGDIVTVTLS